MPFISEDIINKVVAQTEQTTEEQITFFNQRQPMLLAYLTGSQFDLLNEQEKDYFLYLAWILHQSIAQGAESISIANEDQIGTAEEQNWEMMEKTSKGDFRKRLDPFFEKTLQEDLLAFIEDGIIDDEEDFITPVGRELMFVGLKTLVDVLSN
ncbi:MAG: hypothetical protein AAGG68_06490 [Bacteroidota bacterium]